MTELKPLSTLPPTAKLFVGLFTTLMLMVCFWAVWIYTVDRGGVEQHPAVRQLSPDEEIEVIASDSEAVLAPIWDSNHAGEPEPLDSARIDSMESMADLTDGYDGVGGDNAYEGTSESHLRRNLGLAHVHVNGQTLLFFALGAVFLFTSVKTRTKKIILWLFAVTIVAHTVGLTGEGYYSYFDDLLALSGVIMLALIGYMCLMIYVELGSSPQKER